MTFRPNRTTLTTVAAALAMFAGTALAGPGHGHDHGKKSRGGPQGDPSTMVLRMLAHQVESLDLTDAQSAAVEAIFEDSKADLEANREASRDNRKALHGILVADALDDDALATAARTEGDLVAERIVIAATAASMVKAELNTEQLAELHAQAEKFRERAMARHEARKARFDNAE